MEGRPLGEASIACTTFSCSVRAKTVVSGEGMLVSAAKEGAFLLQCLASATPSSHPHPSGMPVVSSIDCCHHTRHWLILFCPAQLFAWGASHSHGLHVPQSSDEGDSQQSHSPCQWF